MSLTATYNNWDTTADEITVQLDSLVTLHPPMERYDGNSYEQIPLNDSFVTPIIILLFIFLSLSLNRGSQIFNKILLNLFSVRRRRTDYEVKSIYDSYINIFFVLTSIVTQGLLLYFGLTKWGSVPINYSLNTIISLTIYAGIFLLFRILLIQLVWYIFSDRASTQLALSGLIASQKLLGLLLIVPIIVMVLNPNLIEIMLIISAIFYFISNIIFYIKIWRIFFTNVYYLFFFILYLCTVEIIPIFNFYIGMFQLNRFYIF